jgi:hypothetical protein
MFKVDLKTKQVEKSNNTMPTLEQIMPNPGFKIVLKKLNPVKTF